jgi:hypothetical protein
VKITCSGFEAEAARDVQEKLDVEACKRTVGLGEGVGLCVAHGADADDLRVDQAIGVVIGGQGRALKPAHATKRAIAPLRTGDINDLRIPVLLMSSLHSEGLLFFSAFEQKRRISIAP